MRIKVLFLLFAVFFPACVADTSAPPPETTRLDIVMGGEKIRVVRPEGYMDVKARIVSKMEKRMRKVLGKTVRRFEDIRKRCENDYESLKLPFEIEAVVLPLKNLYSAEGEVYEKTVEKITNRYLAEMDQVLDFVVEMVWKIAFEVVGSKDVGTGYDTRTGINDVDDIANATIGLVRFRAGRDEFVDASDYQRRKRIQLSRIYKHEVKKQGKFAIFASEPIYHYFSPREDGLAYTIVFHSELSVGTPIELRQAVRNRVTRGGTNIYNSGFLWDNTIGAPGGKLPLRSGVSDPAYIVSRVFTPSLNMDAPNFKKWRDFTAVRDYKTAVVNSETGEILDCVSWQIVCHISHNGVVTVDKGSTPFLDEKAQEIGALLKGKG